MYRQRYNIYTQLYLNIKYSQNWCKNKWKNKTFPNFQGISKTVIETAYTRAEYQTTTTILTVSIISKSVAQGQDTVLSIKVINPLLFSCEICGFLLFDVVWIVKTIEHNYINK